MADELISQIAYRFRQSSGYSVDNPAHWVNRTVHRQMIEIVRKKKPELRPRGHRKERLTVTRINNDGDSVEVERPELADAGFSLSLRERADKLTQFRRDLFLGLIERYGALAINDRGATQNDLNEALLQNIVAEFTDRLEDVQSIADLRKLSNKSNVS
jgi:hypothetical protein